MALLKINHFTFYNADVAQPGFIQLVKQPGYNTYNLKIFLSKDRSVPPVVVK
jgi:hypothetical protein